MYGVWKRKKCRDGVQMESKASALGRLAKAILSTVISQ